VIRTELRVERRYFAPAIEDLVEYWTRYLGAWATARQARDTVVAVTAVDRNPVGVVAAEAAGVGSDARTSRTSSRPAARRPSGPLHRAGGIERLFTLFASSF
jgi:hypothetical protein